MTNPLRQVFDMPKTFSEVSQDALQLGGADQLKLANMLLKSVDCETANTAIEVEEEWDQEIDRRLEELRSGVVKGIPLAEVKDKIEAKFRS